MNWTGGKLQRLKAGRHNNIIRKQKEHFAKLRTRLQSNIGFSVDLWTDDTSISSRLPPFGPKNERVVGCTKRPKERRGREESHPLLRLRYRQGAGLHHGAGGSPQGTYHCEASPFGSGKPPTLSPISLVLSRSLTDTPM